MKTVARPATNRRKNTPAGRATSTRRRMRLNPMAIVPLLARAKTPTAIDPSTGSHSDGANQRSHLAGQISIVKAVRDPLQSGFGAGRKVHCLPKPPRDVVWTVRIGTDADAKFIDHSRQRAFTG